MEIVEIDLEADEEAGKFFPYSKDSKGIYTTANPLKLKGTQHSKEVITFGI